MKIGFITTYFYPMKGGVESNVFYMAKELVRRGHEVHVYASDRKGKDVWSSEEVVEGIKIHRCRTLFRFGYYGVLNSNIFAKMRKEQFDVVHVHSLGFFGQDAAALMYKWVHPKTKLVLTPHGPFMALQYGFVKRMIKKIAEGMIRVVIQGYDRVVEVNPFQNEWLVRQYGVQKGKIVYVPNGIPSEMVLKGKKKRNAKVMLTYVGRLNAYKGVQDVVVALARLGKGAPVQFTIMTTDHENAKAVQELVKEKGMEKKVKFVFDANEQKKQKLLQQSDIFMMPSQWEAFSIAMLEAMAQKNAISSTKTEGGKFLIEEFENGLLYDFGNVKQLEEAMVALIEKSAMRKRMQEANGKKAKEFVWPIIAEKMEQEYVRMVEQ